MATPYEPPTAPPSGAPGGTTSLGIDANLASMLCYLTMICCGLGIIVSLIFFIMEKTNRLLRFHAMQALLFGGVWIVLGVAMRILSALLSIGDLDLGLFIFWGLLLVRVLIALFLLVFLILAAIKAYQGQYYKLPIIGSIAWNIVNK
jgi:uncharacterized membrane protein